jgi:hypothetical protein
MGDPLPSDTLLFREMKARWPKEIAQALPMAAVAYATEIMEDMHKAGAQVPLHTKQGYTMQSTIEIIVQQAMDKAVEAYREMRWWRRLERKITGREWP